MAHTLQNALEMGQEARTVQIDFSAAFDRVDHKGILFKLCSVGVGCSVLSVLTQFLSNRSHVCHGGWCTRGDGVSGGWVRGRPRLGWMDGVKVALGNRGMAV